MKITLIYDNDLYRKDLRANWGFSCLVEAEQTPTILFDTGTNGSILLSNMEKLGIDPKTIDEVFISHSHFDHTGGLSHFLNKNSDITLYAPSSIREIRGVKNFISISTPMRIHENVFSTGELNGIEQSMGVKTDKGIVLIVGCSHPGVRRIIKAISQFGDVYAVVGGLHGFSEFGLIEDIEKICPTHCTQYTKEIRSLYPEKFISGGAGQVIVF